MGIPKRYSSVFIDSGNGWFENSNPNYSALGLEEAVGSFSSDGIRTKIRFNNNIESLNEDPLQILDHFLAQGYTAVGYIGYEYSRYTMEGYKPNSPKEGDAFPDTNFLLYKNVQQPTPCTNELLFRDLQLPQITRKSGVINTSSPSHLCSNMTKSQYIDMVNKGRSYIEQGDIYQVNLSQRFKTQFKLDPLEYFLKFYSVQPVPFGCYLDFGDYQLLSGSMELFLRKSGNKLVTNPIKGTIKRGKTDEIDTILKAKLISSEKERAENLMIVDLMRNDLARVSKTGTVKVNRLFDIESYTTLHQMVSEVESEAYENLKASQIVRALFPPGSVTGAPKRRTLEVIDELEPHLRGPYCGTIGIFYPNGDFVLSVAIRTMVTKMGKATFHVGGGIVWDSDAEREYEETILKSKALTNALCAVLT